MQVSETESTTVDGRTDDTAASPAHNIPALIALLLERAARKLGRATPQVSAAAHAALARYPWPGGVDELTNVVEHLVDSNSANERIELRDLPISVWLAAGEGINAGEFAFELPFAGVDLNTVERDFVIQALSRTHGNQSAAARLLGVSRFVLRYRITKHGLHPKRAARG